MPVLALADAAALLPDRGVLLGLDLGSKTIGVAASDPDRRVAAPVETISRKRFTLDAGRILALAAERRAAGFVLGLPVNMDGSEGPRAQSTRAFARNLARLTELPSALWDERLSTAAVERARRRLYPARRARPASPRTTDKLVKNGPVHRTTRRSDPSRVPRPTRSHPLRCLGTDTAASYCSFQCIVSRPGRSGLAGTVGLGL